MDSNTEGKSLRIEEGIDRLSDLPDFILCKILSFLPTKHAVAATILSTRWKHITPFHAPPINLDLDENLLLHPVDFVDFDGWNSPSKSFADLVDRLFNTTLLDVSCVESMRLVSDNDEKIVSWVSAALRLNLRQLELYWQPSEPDDSLFSCLNGCTTLSKLVLSMERSLFLPDNFSLPNLKRLELYTIIFNDNDCYQMLCGCPALEELLLCDCILDDIVSDHYCIKSHLLKKLAIVYGRGHLKRGLGFRVPNLEELILRDSCADGYTICNITSLRRAYIDYAEVGVSELVTACSTTTSLHLTADSIIGIQNSSMQLPVFQKLTCLSIACLKVSQGLEVLARLLWNTPNLEKLILEEGFDEDKGGYGKFELLVPSPPICVELHVKEIEFWVLKETEEDEMKLMEYFLKTEKLWRNLYFIALLLRIGAL